VSDSYSFYELEGAAANENEDKRLTVKAMQSDPWSAVYQPLPPDADGVLLAAVAVVTDQCAKSAFAAARVCEVVQPELAGYYRERQMDAHDRRAEAREKLASPGTGDMSTVSPFLDRDDLQRKAVVSLLNIGGQRQRMEGTFWPEYVTPEAIDKNPWAAAFSLLPNVVSPELAARVAKTALGLFKDAVEHRDASYTREESEVWNAHVEAALEACAEACRELDRARTGQRVELAAPVGGEAFEKTALELQRDGGHAVENLERAPATAGLEQGIKLADEPLTRDAIARDPWNAVTLEIPENASRELLRLIAVTAQDLQRSFHGRATREPATEDVAREWLDLVAEAQERRKDAEERLVALDAPTAEVVRLDGSNIRSVKAGEMEENSFGRAAFDATEPDGRVRAAWQGSEFSRATIEADPWTAVYLEVPEDADRWLLMKAIDAANQCQDMIARGDPGAGPQLKQSDHGPADNVRQAAERFHELSHRLDGVVRATPALEASPSYEELTAATVNKTEPAGRVEAREEFTRADVQQNPWAVVDKAIPEAADLELLTQARLAVAYCVEAAGHDMIGPAENVFLQEHVEKRFEAASARLAELDARLELARGAGTAPWQEPVREITEDSIALDPWSAVMDEIPKNAGVDLLDRIAATAQELRDEATVRGVAAQNVEDADRWYGLAQQADYRFDEAVVKHGDTRARDAWQQPEFSRDTIDADVWTAVYLPIPQKADAELLAYARSWASDLEQHAARDGVLSEPLVDRESYTRDGNIAAAAARTAELDARLEAVREVVRIPEAKSKAELAADILSSMGDMHSHYDIEPRDGGFAFVRTFEIDDAMLAEYGVPGEQVFGWAKTLDAMHDRIIDGEHRHREFVSKDRLTPEAAAASAAPGQEATPTAERLGGAQIEIRDVRGGNTLTADLDTPEGREAAAAFFAEVAERKFAGMTAVDRFVDRAGDVMGAIEGVVQPMIDKAVEIGRGLFGRDEFTVEEVQQNPWAAVDKDIPRDADSETLAQALLAAASCVEALEWDIGQRQEGARYNPRFGLDKRYDQATARLAELDERLQAQTIDRTPEIEATRANTYGPFLSPDFIRSRVSEHAARVVDLVLGAALGYFVDEPVLTPEQARNQARADAERAEARGFEAARREDAAALDEVNTEINHHRSPVHSGAGDEPTRPETMYEKYPGLTHGDSGYEEERRQESDRAFYDSGIERGR
jgi:hypothetical protein